jgi:hypothetical protein
MGRCTHLALAALAQRAGEAISMTDLAASISHLGGQKRGTAPVERDLKYKLSNPFAKVVPNGETRKLIELVRGTGLRLNLRPEAVRLVLRDGPA